MPTIKLEVNGTEHEVETAPLTLICHKDDIDLKALDPDVVEITPQDTVKCTNEISQDDWDFIRKVPRFVSWWNIVFPDINLPLVLKNAPLAHKHVIGMLVLIAKAMFERKRTFVRLPESYLHPSTQRELANLFATLTKGEK